MNSTRSIFILVLFLSSFCLSSQNSVLWRITGKNLQAPSYLYGTMHLKDKRLFQVNDSLVNYINSCDVFAGELHPDSLNAMMFNMINQKDTNVFKGSLSDEDYKLIDEKLEHDLGIRLSQVKNKNFKYLKLLLNPAAKKADDYPTFLDGYLLGIAKRKGKIISGLEDTRSHGVAIDAIKSEELNKKDVIAMAKDADYAKYLEILIENYLHADFDAIQQKMSAYSYEFQDGLLYKRNKVMAHSIDSIVQSKTLFAACGVAHLVGKEGVVQLLRNLGYTVTPVLSTKKSYLSMANMPLNYNDWQLTSVPALGVNYELPGVPIAYSRNIMYADAKMYTDISSGCSYFILPMAIATAVEDQDAIFNKAALAMKNRVPGSVIKYSKKIDYHGVRGEEIMLAVESGVAARVRILINNNILYVFLVSFPGKFESTEEFDHFFNSISFYKPVKTDLVNYKSSYWDFSMDFPSKPDEKNDIKKTLNSRTEYLQLKSSDNLSQIHYIMECAEVKNGSFFSSDSVILNAVKDRIKENQHVLTMKDTLFTYQGSPVKQVKFYFDDQSMLVSRSIIRGYRFFNLMAIFPKQNEAEGKHEAIFNSLKFNPTGLGDMKSYPVPFDSSLVIEFSSPLKKKNYEEGEDSERDTLDTIYYSVDKHTAVTYFVQKQVKGPYYYTTNDSIVWAKFKSNFMDDGDSLLSEEKIPGIANIRLYTKQRKNSYVREMYAVVNLGKVRYDVYAYMPGTETNERFSAPFRSIRYTGKFRPHYVADTTAFRELMRDMSSTDTTIKKSAWEAFRYFQITDNMFPEIKRLLNSHDLKKDTAISAYLDPKRYLIESLGDLKNTDPVVDLITEKLNDTAEVRQYSTSYVVQLSRIHTKKSYEKLGAFLQAHLQNFEDYDFCFYNAKDSMKLGALLFPYVAPVLQNDTILCYSFISFCKDMLDDSIISYTALAPYENGLYKRSTHILTENVKPKDPYNSYYNDELLSVLNHAENKEALYRHLTEMAQSNNIWGRFYSCIFRIKNKVPVTEKEMLFLADFPYVRGQLYSNLMELGRTDLFPDKYRDQQSIAEADLAYSVYNNDEAEPENIKFLRKMEMPEDGKTAEYYLFQLKIKDDRGKHLGIAGPYFSSEGLNPHGNITGMSWEDYTKNKELDIFMNYIHPTSE